MNYRVDMPWALLRLRSFIPQARRRIRTMASRISGKIYGVLERMEDIGMPLLVHGEVTDPDVDIFDREQVFIDNVLIPTLQRFDCLKGCI